MRRRRRLPRILLNAATAVSVVLCVAMLALWIRSYGVADWLGYAGEDHAYWIAHSRGRLMGARVFAGAGSAGAWYAALRPGLELTDLGPLMLNTVLDQAGFILKFDDPCPDALLVKVQVPHWAAAGAMLLLPLGRLAVRRARTRARRAGHCPSCGYDLRATPARCPECGTVQARVTPP